MGGHQKLFLHWSLILLFAFLKCIGTFECVHMYKAHYKNGSLSKILLFEICFNVISFTEVGKQKIKAIAYANHRIIES